MPDFLDPRTQGYSVSPYPPELQGEAAALHRRRALADMLLMRSMQPIQQPTGYGGIPVPISPFAGLAHIAQAGLGGMAGQGVDQGEAALANRYSEGVQGATKQVTDLIKGGDFAGASQIASRWPAMRHVAEALMTQQMPKPAIHTLYGPGSTEQPAVVNLNEPNAPPVPLGGTKSPPLHPVETAGPGGLPQTSFANLNQPELAPMPKPAPLHAANLGGTTELFNPYGPERTLKHTMDPNRVPTPEDLEANAQMIVERRMPALTGYASKAPAGAAIMRRVFEKDPNFNAGDYPIAIAGEKNFLSKNGPQINAFNTLIGHVQAAKEMYAALDNPTDIPRLNAARNQFLREFGSPLPTQLDVAKQFIADESVKAVLNGPGALDDRKAMAEKLKASSSPAQFEADANTVIKFGVEKLKAHEQQYKSATSRHRADFQERFLTPSSKATYNQYGGGRRVSDTPGLPDPAAIDAELARRTAAGGR